MRHAHGRSHTVASLGSARPAEADVHAGIRCRLIGVVVVGQELLSELTLWTVVDLHKPPEDTE